MSNAEEEVRQRRLRLVGQDEVDFREEVQPEGAQGEALQDEAEENPNADLQANPLVLPIANNQVLEGVNNEADAGNVQGREREPVPPRVPAAPRQPRILEQDPQRLLNPPMQLPVNATPVYSLPFTQGNRFLDEYKLAEDLDSYGKWCEGHGMRSVRDRQTLIESMLPAAIVQELALRRTNAANEVHTWEEAVDEYLESAREVLGGAELYKEFHALKIKKNETAREFWGRVYNCSRLLNPRETAQIQAGQVFCRGFTKAKIVSKLLEKLYTNPHIAPTELVRLAQKEEKRQNSSEEEPTHRPQFKLKYEKNSWPNTPNYQKGRRFPEVNAVQAEENDTFKRKNSWAIQNFPNKGIGKGKGANKRGKFGGKGTGNKGYNPNEQVIWQLGKIRVYPRFDSGADKTVISESLYKKIKDQLSSDEEAVMELTFGNGTKGQSSRRISFKLSDPQRATLDCVGYVIQGNKDLLLLSLATMHRNKVFVDYNTCRIRVQQTWMDLPGFEKERLTEV
jgi:hypothetical protein